MVVLSRSDLEAGDIEEFVAVLGLLGLTLKAFSKAHPSHASALHFATTAPGVRAMLNLGASPNQPDIGGETPLHHIVRNSHATAAVELLNTGVVKANRANGVGERALQFAVQHYCTAAIAA